jgi:hypothetical protein
MIVGRPARKILGRFSEDRMTVDPMAISQHTGTPIRRRRRRTATAAA